MDQLVCPEKTFFKQNTPLNFVKNLNRHVSTFSGATGQSGLQGPAGPKGSKGAAGEKKASIQYNGCILPQTAMIIPMHGLKGVPCLDGFCRISDM